MLFFHFNSHRRTFVRSFVRSMFFTRAVTGDSRANKHFGSPSFTMLQQYSHIVEHAGATVLGRPHVPVPHVHFSSADALDFSAF